MRRLLRRLVLISFFLGLGGFLGHAIGIKKAHDAAVDCKIKSASQEEVILMICEYETAKFHGFGILIGMVVGAALGIAISEITMPNKFV